MNLIQVWVLLAKLYSHLSENAIDNDAVYSVLIVSVTNIFVYYFDYPLNILWLKSLPFKFGSWFSSASSDIDEYGAAPA